MRLDDLIEGLAAPAALTRRSREIVASNEAFRRRFCDGKDPLGRTCHEVLHRLDEPCARHGVTCPVDQIRGGARAVRTLHHHYAGGRKTPTELYVSALGDPQQPWTLFLHLSREPPDQVEPPRGSCEHER